MQVSPRYDGPTIITISGDPLDQLAPVIRQRRRLQGALADLVPAQWSAASRCAGWTIKDVVSHLAGVNQFWTASIEAGLSGDATRWLSGFDPVATPEAMVASTRKLDAHEVFQRFADSNDRLLTTLEGLSIDQWSLPAEAPPGHLPIRLVASHALWDSWIHERDVFVPLEMTLDEIDDEVGSSLRYVAALSAAFGVMTGHFESGQFAMVATAPDVACVIEVSDHVEMRDATAPSVVPTLRGDAVELLEALSFRSPLPADAPEGWRKLMNGLANVFNTEI